MQYTFMEEIDGLNLEKIGPAFENHFLFPRPGQHRVCRADRPWTYSDESMGERQRGDLAANWRYGKRGGVHSQRIHRTTPVDVALRGGHLLIEWNRETQPGLYDRGPAVKVFTGEYDWDRRK